ncbi:endo-1,4-beta-mannosidase [Klebsormidium nitens]|uniref:mannan endo-1,4-beta-mannosidase n=1 Tax=Klebsormidium nitens TaxID=105231 RepID=A0A1Y1IDV7_KLENI|nr:endo-1,4-beta-mannosidase [Klebsormidium nitens]|eukprot:GAQ88142.1 endo-1,4-beta-mannosidase [Klebsormidium nitens]
MAHLSVHSTSEHRPDFWSRAFLFSQRATSKTIRSCETDSRLQGKKYPQSPLASKKTTLQAIFFIMSSVLAHHLTAGDPQQLPMEQFVKSAGQRFELEDGSPFYMTGPDDMPYRVTPSLMPSSGIYNEEVFKGLDFFLDALRKRNMRRFYNDTSIALKCQNMLQRTWIEATASFVKDIDSRHMLTTGSEGKEFVEYEDEGNWVENWEIYKPYNGSDSNLESAINFARRFLKAHNEFAASFGKPLVLEEYGLARDSFPINMNRYDPKSPVTHRDKYFRAVLDQVSALSREGYMAGQMFWAWAGEGRPQCKMPVGDPPHENPGWYSVYDIDESTMALFASFNKQLQTDGRKC